MPEEKRGRLLAAQNRPDSRESLGTVAETASGGKTSVGSHATRANRLSKILLSSSCFYPFYPLAGSVIVANEVIGTVRLVIIADSRTGSIL